MIERAYMITSKEIEHNYIEIGYNKCNMNIAKCFILAILAGMFIAFGGLSSSVASCMIENSSLAKLIQSVVFPAGLAMVVAVGAELFTGDCLITISVLERKANVLKFIRTLIIVYIGNLVGSILVALMVVYGHTLSAFDGALAQNIVDIAAKKCEIGFGDAIIRGILCNILVCSAVWMSMTTKSAAGKIVALFMPIMVFVISGFEHSVANMFYIPAGIMALKEYGVEAEGLNWFNFFITNELPVTIGNLIGGISLSVALWFTQSQKAKK